MLLTDSVWRVVGVSVQGTSHVAAGLPCQDAHVCRVLPSGELVLAIADGAGSAPCSADGAQAAAVEAVATLAAGVPERGAWVERGWAGLMASAFEAAHAAVAQLAAGSGRSMRDFATTLTCVIARDDCVVTGQLGDGLAVAERGAGLELVARPQRGEYANEAYFLSMPGALDYLQVRVGWEPVQALAASTDGLLRLALQLPSYTPHAPFFRPLFDFLAATGDEAAARRQLVKFLDGARVRVRTDDDKTLVLAVRVPSSSRARLDGHLLALPEPGFASAALGVDEGLR